MKRKLLSVLLALVLVLTLGLVTAVPVAAQSLEITGVTVGTWTHIDTAEEERYIEAVKGENVLFWNDGTQLRRATYTWDGTTLTLGTATSPTGLTYSSGTNDPHNVYMTPNVLNNGEGNLEAYFQPRGGTANGVFHATSTDNGASWTLDAVLAGFTGSGVSLDGSILLPNDDVGWVYNAAHATGADQVSGVNGVIESGAERRLYGENRLGDVMLWTCTAGNNGPFTRTAVLIDNHTDGSPLMENVAPSGDAIKLGTGEVIYFYVDGNFYKPWDNEANKGAVGVLVLDAAGEDFIYQQHDFVRVDDADLVAAGLTALEEATVTNVEFSGNQMTALLMLVGANDDPATWGDYGGSPDPRASTDHDIFYAPVTVTFNQIVAPPATTVYVDATWASQAGVDAFDSSLIWQYDAFASIQDGIDIVAEDGTVNVAAGEYTGYAGIGKQLTLQGAQHGVDPTVAGARTLEAEESVINGQGISLGGGAVGVTVDGFTVTDSSGIDLNGPASCTIINNIVSGASPYGLRVDSSDGNTIANNRISGSADAGLWLNSSNNNRIENNLVFENFLNPNDWGGGIELDRSSNNTLIGNTVFGEYTGIGITGFRGDANNNTLTQNTIFDNSDHGICIYDGNIGGESGTIIGTIITYNTIEGNNKKGISVYNSAPNTEVHFNNIVDNIEYGVYNGTVSDDVNATNNWWGHASGPADALKLAATGYTAYGNAVSGNVDYEPWLLAEVNIVEVAAGEEPTIYEKTLALKDGWTLISVDKAVASPAWVGMTLAFEYTPTGGFPEATLADLEPLTAIYVKTEGGGGVGFDYAAEGEAPPVYSKELEAGWNLISSPSVVMAGGILSPLGKVTIGTQQGVGLSTLVSLGNYNQFTGDFYLATLTDADWGILNSTSLNPFDGYWAYMNAAKAFEVPVP